MPAKRWWSYRPKRLFKRTGFEWSHHTLDRSRSRSSVLCGVVADYQGTFRIHLAADRLSVALPLGREPLPCRSALEQSDCDLRHGIRCVAHAGIAKTNDCPRQFIRHTGLSVGPREVASKC